MSNDEETMRRVRELQPFSVPSGLQEKLLTIPEQHERPVRFFQRFMKVAPFGFAAAAAIGCRFEYQGCLQRYALSNY